MARGEKPHLPRQVNPCKNRKNGAPKFKGEENRARAGNRVYNAGKSLRGFPVNSERLRNLETRWRQL